MVIDDNRADSDYLTEILPSSGYRINTSDSISSAMDQLSKERADIILLDLFLNDSKGLATFNIIRNRAPDIPIIILSGNDNDSLIDGSLKNGAQDYLIKGCFDSALLQHVIRCSVKRHTLLKKMESDSLERYHLIVDKSTDGIIIVLKKSGKICFVNPAAESLFGRKKEEIIDETFGFPIVINEATDIQIINKNGEITTSDMHIVEITWDSEPAYLVLLRDITQRRKLEEERKKIHIKMLTASKLTTLGEVAASVAHEINQPLTFLNSFAQGLKYDLKDNSLDLEELKESVPQALKQVKRIIDISQNMRDFSRRDEIMKEPVNIESVLENTLMLMQERLRLRNISLEQSVSPNTPLLTANAGQLEQVFINLFQNAIDSFSANKEKPAIDVKIFPSKNKKSIHVEFSDNGMGIDAENIDKIFEPFFTTKAVGKGTGLGLSIIQGIIEDHKGTITCESKVERGTTFRIALPVNNGRPVE